MRLGDLDALKETKYVYHDNGEVGERLYISFDEIDNAPTIDAVPVVRCKDCKWWEGKRWDSSSDPQYGYCHACKHAHYSEHWEISIRRQYKADWFCADGERQ